MASCPQENVVPTSGEAGPSTRVEHEGGRDVLGFLDLEAVDSDEEDEEEDEEDSGELFRFFVLSSFLSTNMDSLY